MKKVEKIAILSCLIMSSSVAQEVSLKFFNNLDIVESGGIKVTKYQELDNIYHLKGEPLLSQGQKKPFEFFLTKNFKQIILGRAIDSKTQAEVKFKPNKEYLEALKGAEALSYGTGKEVIYVFTDPECPYCKKFEKKLPSLKDKYTFKVFMFPLSFHQNAKQMSRYIMAGETQEVKFDRMLEVANDLTTYKRYKGTTEENQRLNREIEKQIKLGTDVEINGTPVAMKPDGTMLNWPDL